tara:strand:+ start:142 stop:570 length:429 start_codon:yes stop_codon:yes gene_type:complete
MSFRMLKSVNFGKGKGGLDTVGVSLYDAEGTISGSRITAGVHEVGSNTGIYACQLTFAANFSGSILWDTGESESVYASEQYNPTAERVKFNMDIAGGKWTMDSSTNQIIFYAADNTTEVARFNLTDSDGAGSVSSVFTRTRT